MIKSIFHIFKNSFYIITSFFFSGVRVLLKTQSGLRYVTFSLATGRAESGGDIQQAPSFFLSKTQPQSSILNSSGIVSKILSILLTYFNVLNGQI